MKLTKTEKTHIMMGLTMLQREAQDGYNIAIEQGDKWSMEYNAKRIVKISMLIRKVEDENVG